MTLPPSPQPPAGPRVLSPAAVAVLCGGGLALTLLAVAVARVGATMTASYVLAGVGLLLAGIACSIATVDRVRRETGRRRTAWQWLTVAVVAMSAGQGLMWLLFAAAGVESADLAQALPWLVALPCYLVGVILLPAPLAENVRERLLALLDAVVAWLALVLVYAVAVVPFIEEAAEVYEPASIDLLRPWLNLLGLVLLVFVATRCRFVGGLPWGQLRLWVYAVLLFLAGDLFAHTVWAARELRVPTLATVATAGAAWLAVATASRDAAEVETPAQTRARERFSMLFPLAPPVVAVAVVAWLVVDSGLLTAVQSAVAVTLAVVFLVGLVVLRVLAVDQLREKAVADSRAALESTADTTWFRALVGDTTDIVTVATADGVVVFQTPSVSRVLGYEPGHWRGRRFAELVHDDDLVALEQALALAAGAPGSPRTLDLRVRVREGGWRFADTTVTALPGRDGLHGYVLTCRDVTDRRELRDRLERQAQTDQLTGLANRAAMKHQLAESLRGSAPGHVAVLSLDLDDFSAINDSLGHTAGDQLLAQVAASLERCVRPWDLVARIGGDEFAVLVVSRGAERAVVRVQERVRRALAGTVTVDGNHVVLTASAGYAISDIGDESADDMLRNADLALARARGGHRVEMLRFEQEMHEALLVRVTEERELRLALARHELFMTYQPVFHLRTGAMIGAEALVRWQHPARGVLTAADFMPLAEDTGLVRDIGAWVLHKVVHDRAELGRRLPGLGEFQCGVNVSPQELGGELVRAVRDALAEAGIPGEALLLEVTESSLVTRPLEAAEVIRRVRELGVLVALDDFGTGYSSLGLLSQFEVDLLKIDKSFVADMAHGAQRTALARTIVHLAGALGLHSVAEGVETATQVELLTAMGCDFAQGFLFAEPIGLDDLETMLRHQLAADPGTMAPPTRVVLEGARDTAQPSTPGAT